MLRYINWLEAGEELKIKEGNNVQVYNFKYQEDDEILDEWATHFRQNYCSDKEIDILRDGTGLSRTDFLLKYKFPDQKKTPGPSIRAGDFCELLLVDYFEFKLGYYVPRTRYDGKTIPDESTKGSDILAFKVVGKEYSQEDILVVDEVKGTLSRSGNKARLQDAIDHSKKDYERLAESLQAAKQRLYFKGDNEKVELIKRFQNISDTPYVLRYGASAVIDDKFYDKDILSKSTIKQHPDKNILLVVIKGNELMKLANDLYRRASLC